MNQYFAWFGLKGSLVLTTLMSSFALVLAAVFPSPSRWLCFAAMFMSSVGDIFLMHDEWIEKNIPNYFVFGAAAFMVAHLLYTACFSLKIRAAGQAYFNGGVWIALAIAAICLIYFLSVYRNKEILPLAIVYLAIISINCMTVFSWAWGQGWGSPLSVLAALGAASFLASDLVIGLGKLCGIHQYDGLIWWLYPIGQLLLIIGAHG